MTTPATTTEHTVTADADRVLAGLTPAQRLLAAHAALPAAVDTGLVRLMRDNFLLDGPLEEQLPVTAESEAAMARLLLSPLFSQVDDDLYEMHVAARAVLLAELERIDDGGRLIEVAVLLERYVVERAQWTTELQWAQKISARVVTDPADVQQFLAAGAAQGGGHGLDGRWYAAVRARVEQQQVASATLQQEVADSPAGDDADLVALLVRTYPTPADVERFLSRQRTGRSHRVVRSAAAHHGGRRDRRAGARHARRHRRHRLARRRRRRAGRSLPDRHAGRRPGRDPAFTARITGDRVPGGLHGPVGHRRARRR